MIENYMVEAQNSDIFSKLVTLLNVQLFLIDVKDKNWPNAKSLDYNWESKLVLSSFIGSITVIISEKVNRFTFAKALKQSVNQININNNNMKQFLETFFK